MHKEGYPWSTFPSLSIRWVWMNLVENSSYAHVIYMARPRRSVPDGSQKPARCFPQMLANFPEAYKNSSWILDPQMLPMCLPDVSWTAPKWLTDRLTECMNGWDGWLGRRVNEWRKGRMNEYINGFINKLINIRLVAISLSIYIYTCVVCECIYIYTCIYIYISYTHIYIYIYLCMHIYTIPNQACVF